MGKAFWALGTLLELLIAVRHLGKLQKANRDATARTVCPVRNDGLLSWGCHQGMSPACAYLDPYCDAAHYLPGLPQAKPTLPEWGVHVEDDASGSRAKALAANSTVEHILTSSLSAWQAAMVYISTGSNSAFDPGFDQGQDHVRVGSTAQGNLTPQNSTSNNSAFHAQARLLSEASNPVSRRFALHVMAAAIAVAFIALALVALASRRPQQQHGFESSYLSDTAAATPQPGCVGQFTGAAASGDYFALDAWEQENDQYNFAARSSVRRSGRLVGNVRSRQAQVTTGLTPTPVAAEPESELGIGMLGTRVHKEGEKEEGVWVRGSRGTWGEGWLGGMQSLLQSPVAAITPKSPGSVNRGLERAEDEDWSPSAGRVLRLRWRPPEPSTGRQQDREKGLRSASRPAREPAAISKTPARSFRGRQSTVNPLYEDTPSRGSLNTAGKPPRGRKEVFWA